MRDIRIIFFYCLIISGFIGCSDNIQPEHKLYSFGVLSDVHMPSSNDNDANKSKEDFSKALSFLESNEVVLIGISGDITNRGLQPELMNYSTVVDSFHMRSDIPVYTCLGNHETWNRDWDNTPTDDSNYVPYREIWKTYTGMGICMSGNVEVCPTMDADICVNYGNDHFIFFSVEKQEWVHGKCDDIYTKPSRIWLGSILEKYKNDRCFVFIHFFFPERSGNYGRVYNNKLWLSGDALSELEDLADKYGKSVWISGHSHCEWALDDNIYENKNGGYCIHISSCSEPRGVENESMYSIPEGSEMAIIDVYEHRIVLHGYSMIDGVLTQVKSYDLKL